MTALAPFLDVNLRLPVFISFSVLLVGSSTIYQHGSDSKFDVSLMTRANSLEYLHDRASDGYTYAEALLSKYNDSDVEIRRANVSHTVPAKASDFASCTTQRQTCETALELPVSSSTVLLMISLWTMFFILIVAGVRTQVIRCKQSGSKASTATDAKDLEMRSEPSESEPRKWWELLVNKDANFLQRECWRLKSQRLSTLRCKQLHSQSQSMDVPHWTPCNLLKITVGNTTSRTTDYTAI